MLEQERCPKGGVIVVKVGYFGPAFTGKTSCADLSVTLLRLNDPSLPKGDPGDRYTRPSRDGHEFIYYAPSRRPTRQSYVGPVWTRRGWLSDREYFYLLYEGAASRG